MSRTLPTTVASAITSDVTKPVYLIEFSAESPQVRAATWDANISWNGLTWIASGIEVSRLSARGATLKLPNGDDDPWLAMVMDAGGVRGGAVNIYEHHTDLAASPQTDAVLVFSGIMDSVDIADNITIRVLDSSQSKVFPPTSADESVFTHLLTPGQKISWGNDTITVT